MNLPNSLQERLSLLLGGDVQVVRAVGGGCISPAAIIGVGKNYYFLKWNTSSPKGFFAAEAMGLKELRLVNEVRVPELLCFEDGELGASFIVLELLLPGEQTRKASEELGFALAKLHQHKSSNYGFSADNFIGSLRQQNVLAASWGEFFFERRLVAQAQIGSEAGWFDTNFDRLLAKKRDRIIKELNEVDGEGASLVHGDLWSGNVYWTPQGAALIDPAVYYGSREVDLAFSEMFGGFDREFYNSYNEVYPLSAGYQKRKPILNLYHLMTHSNLFGGSYISDAYSVLTRI